MIRFTYEYRGTTSIAPIKIAVELPYDDVSLESIVDGFVRFLKAAEYPIPEELQESE